MKPGIKYIPALTAEEMALFKKSGLYEQVAAEYLYTDLSKAYYSAYHQTSKDHSFVISAADRFLIYAAIHPISETLSYFEFPVRVFVDEAFALDEVMIDALLLLKQQLTQICEEQQFRSMRFYEHPMLLNLFYDKASLQAVEVSGIIDLALSPALIKRNIRKSYKSLVNWGEKHMQTTVYDQANITQEVFDAFEDFHLKVSGKKTRSHETWALQLDMIRKGEAFLVVALYNGVMASANLFLTGTSEVFYGVGVNDRELTEVQNLAIAHYPIYRAALYAKEKGYKVFNLNTLNKPNASDKEKSISFFKKGFTSQLRSTVIYEIQHG